MADPKAEALVDSETLILAPCPFCGEDAAELRDSCVDTDSGDQEHVFVVCGACWAEGPHAFVGCRADEDDAGEIDLETEAACDWNTRSAVFAEREACAVSCEILAAIYRHPSVVDAVDAASFCAARIRSRGDTVGGIKAKTEPRR